MIVTARYFAVLRELRGTSSEAVDLPDGTTAAEAFAALFPGLPLRVAFAVNAVTVASDTALRTGDEIAFLPPLGGG
jgi:molybdopterin converting factor small subunit